MSDDTPAQDQRGKDPETGQFVPDNPWRFPPGQSGNPGGRNVGASIVAPLNRLLSEEPNEHGEGRLAVELAMTAIDIIRGKIEPKAAAVRLKGIQTAMERVDGKVTQEIRAQIEELRITLRDRPDAKRPE